MSEKQPSREDQRAVKVIARLNLRVARLEEALQRISDDCFQVADETREKKHTQESRTWRIVGLLAKKALEEK